MIPDTSLYEAHINSRVSEARVAVRVSNEGVATMVIHGLAHTIVIRPGTGVEIRCATDEQTECLLRLSVDRIKDGGA